uniref:Coiled-coil SMC6 And NSE5 INteracting (CANIN) domain-containing protein n=2 Tax=Davidia involucrata TaxID=16924 RepID=A0A5B7BZX9_DAVIN
MDGPLDFESEDPLLSSPASTKKRKKVIGLDDLLIDYYKEKNKVIEREAKQTKAKKSYNSDEDEDEDSRVTKLSQCVENCQKEMEQINGEDEICLWGLQVFGNQKTPLPLVYPELESCVLLQSFMNNELNSLVELNIEKGETFLESLLVNGWFLKLVYSCSSIEKCIATWTFNLLLYSSKEVLRTSACEFWCAILSPKKEIKIDWLPNYSELKRALKIYGFLLDSPSNSSSNMENIYTDSDCVGPPQNIRAWIKYVAACFQVRHTYSIFSISEAEDLLGVIICLFLDRQLLGLSVILNECMLSATSFFTDNEWSTSCEEVAKSLTCRVPKDMNCLRTVECIAGVDARSKHLRSAVAFQILINCFDNKATDAEEILRLLISINVKDKSCDLFKVYIYLVLTENWLLSNPILEDKPVIYEMWGVYLRNCSCQITSMDLRSYASKVRSKASYLLQGTGNN